MTLHCISNCNMTLPLNTNQRGEEKSQGVIWAGGIGKDACAVNLSKAWLSVCSRLSQPTPLPLQINTIDFPVA